MEPTSCIFTASVATDFVFAPSNFICASKISRCLGSASISIWLRHSERQTQVTKTTQDRDRLVVAVVWTKNSLLFLRINFSLGRDSVHANCIDSLTKIKSYPRERIHTPRAHNNTRLLASMCRFRHSSSIEHTLPLLLPVVRRLPHSVERFQELSDQVLAIYLFLWR